MRKYEISVIITSYNQQELLREALESAINQTYKPLEILVCDDASTDGSHDMILEYAERFGDFIKPILHKENHGVSANRNSGISAAAGKWISFLDGDDVYYPDKLRLEVEALKMNPYAQIAYSNFYFVDENRVKIRIWSEDPQNLPRGDIFFKVFTRDFPSNTLFRGELVSKSLIDQVHGYDEGRAIMEDWDFKIRITRNGHAVCNTTPQLEYRFNAGGIHNTTELEVLRMSRLHVVEKNQQLLDYLPGETKELALRKILRNLRKSDVKAYLRHSTIRQKTKAIADIVRLIIEEPFDGHQYRLIFRSLVPAEVRRSLKRLFGVRANTAGM